MRLLLPVLFLPSVASASPVLSHQARVLNTLGAPVDGPITMQAELFDAQDSVAAFFSESTSTIAQNGYVAVLLGADVGNPIDPADLADGHTWIQLSIDGSPMGARQQLASVPHAAAADTIVDGVVDASSLSVDGTVVMEEPGVFVGDLVVDGTLTTEGVQLPYTITIDSRSWLDETRVQLDGANETLNADGTLTTGGSFTGGGDYLTIPIAAPGVLPDERLSVNVSWHRSCVTSDCDSQTRVEDATNTGWRVASFDNFGGQSPISNASGGELVPFDGLGQATLVYVESLMGGGLPTTLTRRIRLDQQHTHSWVGTQVANPSLGLDLVVIRGSAPEVYTERFIEVTIDRAP